MPSAIDEPARSGTAPSYDVPQHRVVSIEHPCIVNNFDNGFKSLGYEHQLKHVSSNLRHSISSSINSSRYLRTRLEEARRAMALSQ